MYKCKHCGKEFDNRYKLTGHSTHCTMNPKYNQNLEQCAKNVNSKSNKKEKDLTEYHCAFCDKVCIGKNSLRQHELRCKFNPNKIDVTNSTHNLEVYNKNVIDGHITKIATNQYTKAHLSGNPIPIPSQETRRKIGLVWKGKHLSDDMREKQRVGALRFRETMVDSSVFAHYNKKACDYINRLNDEMGWNLQHAENGGEVIIDGYYLDGYDKELNIAFEYDEQRHYKDVENNILIDKDIERQNYIIEKTNCTFYRYNERMNLLYKV